jgi:hypothetical protein
MEFSCALSCGHMKGHSVFTYIYFALLPALLLRGSWDFFRSWVQHLEFYEGVKVLCALILNWDCARVVLCVKSIV